MVANGPVHFSDARNLLPVERFSLKLLDAESSNLGRSKPFRFLCCRVLQFLKKANLFKALTAFYNNENAFLNSLGRAGRVLCAAFQL